MTKKEMFETIATVNADNEEIVAFCEHEIALLANRKTSKSLTKTQKENIEVMDNIKSVLSAMTTPVTVTELLQTEKLQGLSNQKVSALLRKMVIDQTVIKTTEGKKAKFALA